MTEQEAKNLVGNQATVFLKNMIRALDGPLAWTNTPDDTERLEAARIVIRSRR